MWILAIPFIFFLCLILYGAYLSFVAIYQSVEFFLLRIVLYGCLAFFYGLVSFGLLLLIKALI